MKVTEPLGAARSLLDEDVVVRADLVEAVSLTVEVAVLGLGSVCVRGLDQLPFIDAGGGNGEERDRAI